MQSPGPIPGLGIQKALGESHPVDGAKQAALDEAELRELERSMYYAETEPSSEAKPAPRRSIRDRLLRRDRASE